MSSSVRAPKGRPRVTARAVAIPPLENGDRLTSVEFLRRYEAMPDVRKAQLIEGIVHMPSPVRAESHGKPDNLLQTWLGTFACENPGVEAYTNTTLILAPDNTPQPDAMLCTTPRAGGRVWLNDRGYLCGAPELVCEVAASSAAIDLHEKFRAYRRNGVAEYLVWLVSERRIHWWTLEAQEYVELKEHAGVVVSRVFPRLALDTRALLRGDGAKVLATLRKQLAR